MIQENVSIALVATVHKQPTKEWFAALVEHAKEADIIIVDDSNGIVELPSNFLRLDYSAQKDFLGEELYSQFEHYHKSSSCKNVGHAYAFKNNYDVLLGIDSDCNIQQDFVKKHIDGLLMNGYTWTNPISKTGWFPRGYPYFARKRRVSANMGLWTNELDLNGRDRLESTLPIPRQPLAAEHTIATSMMPFSGMNFALLREAIPGFLFLPNIDIRDVRFRRHDDIFGGYIFQKLAHYLNDSVCYGNPLVFHDTIVDAEADAREEVALNNNDEYFYELVDDAIANMSPASSYKEAFAEFTMSAHSTFFGTPLYPFFKEFEFWTQVFNTNV